MGDEACVVQRKEPPGTLPGRPDLLPPYPCTYLGFQYHLKYPPLVPLQYLQVSLFFLFFSTSMVPSRACMLYVWLFSRCPCLRHILSCPLLRLPT